MQPPAIKSYWKKLKESLRELNRSHMCPEYAEDHERNHNYRHYK